VSRSSVEIITIVDTSQVFHSVTWRYHTDWDTRGHWKGFQPTKISTIWRHGYNWITEHRNSY